MTQTSMRLRNILIVLSSCLLLASCGVKKKAISSPPSSVTEPSVPAWHTCLIQGARATITDGDSRYSANVTMQTVHDSMLVISIIPALGMELVRFEATPQELIGINKIDGTYAVTTYEAVNRHLVPAVSWEILQQLCTAELPTGSETARMVYSLGNKNIEMDIVYPERQLDVPVRVSHLRLDKYKKLDISRWL